jgi:Flp pilus assembly protein TadD
MLALLWKPGVIHDPEAAAVFQRLAQSYPDDAEIWIDLANARAKANQSRGPRRRTQSP